MAKRSKKAKQDHVVVEWLAEDKIMLIEHYQDHSPLWKPEESGAYYRSLADLTIGILGVGDIGMEVARTCKFFGMTVLGLTRTDASSHNSSFVDYYRTIDQLPELLSAVDIICSVLPDTEATTNLLGGDMFRNCENKKPVFINVGRGSVIKETDLITAIRNNWIGGAVLDVFEKEPLQADSLLWELPNVVISPHRSALSLPEKVAEGFLENLENYTNGRKMKCLVDWDAQY